MSHCTKALRTLMRNTLCFQEQQDSPYSIKSQLCFPTRIKSSTQNAFHCQDQTLRERFRNRDSSFCSALERLRESKQAFTLLSIYKVKIIRRKNPTEATKVTPILEPGWTWVDNYLLTTAAVTSAPTKIGELRHWNKPSAPLCLCYTDCTKPQRSAKSKIFILYNCVKDLYPSPS